MLEGLLLSLLLLLAFAALVKTQMPSAYTLGIRLFRFVWRLSLWALWGTLRWPTSETRRKYRAAERFVPKRSNPP